MIWKCCKYGVLAVVVGGAVLTAGGLILGSDALSYVTSSAHSVRSAVKDNIPIEFELKRARDLLDEILPEMHANVRLIAQEEVELAALHDDIARSVESLTLERRRMTKVRNALRVEQASYDFGQRRFTRAELRDDLSRRFELIREAELVLDGKHRLQETRQQSLASAIDMLDQTRSKKALLESRIVALESRHRLHVASSAGTMVQADQSKLAQSVRLIDEIKKRLDVAERVMAREARFVEQLEVDVIDETDLFAEVDSYLSGDDTAPTTTVDAGSAVDPLLLPDSRVAVER